VDESQLREIREGGHHVTASPGRVEVWVYQTGPAYGHWLLDRPPSGDKVRALHSLPTRYAPDGSFVDPQPVDDGDRVLSVDQLRSDAEGCLAPLLGRTIAEEVAPMAKLALVDFAA